jgi:hypothetical protein
MSFARPLQGTEVPIGPAGPTARSCSVLVVSHHLDGFLRAEACGSIAPHCRTGVRRVSRFTALPATRFTPSEDFPSPAAAPHLCGRCLLAVTVSLESETKGRLDEAPIRRSGPPRHRAQGRTSYAEALLYRCAEPSDRGRHRGACLDQKTRPPESWPAPEAPGDPPRTPEGIALVLRSRSHVAVEPRLHRSHRSERGAGPSFLREAANYKALLR